MGHSKALKTRLAKREGVKPFWSEQELGQEEWGKTYRLFLELVNSTGKIESLPEQGYDNWLLSLFYIAGIDKIDLIMKKEKGVEAVKNTILTAYHEAGHAVYDWLMGMAGNDIRIIIHPIQRRGVVTIEHAISLIEEDGPIARMRRTLLDEPEDPDYDAFIDTYLAGYVTEDRLLRSFNFKPGGVDKHSPDYSNWDYLLSRKYPNDTKKQRGIRLAQHYRKVKEIFYMDIMWTAVQEVAEKLLSQAFMTFVDLDKIMKARHLEPRRSIQLYRS